ncbi:hypothetical protein M9Y10_002085 [Tritrichomonas musculus]|uniref:VASt domain-containing protein n=1 Tax=Tritrichomonas musculus TaxID=1915356 RepID=A0ABR2L9Q2_9EUKA
MEGFDDYITKFSCFLVQKVSNYGSLVLRTNTISFIFANHKEKDIVIDYKSITDFNAQTRFGDAITNFDIRVKDQLYSFSGIHEVQQLNDLIKLRQQQLTEPKITYGFVNQDKNKVQWRELNDPILLYSCMVPATFDQVKEQILNKSFFSEVYSDNGSMNVNLEEWTEKNGYKERTIFYNKMLILPLFGKKLLNLSELQRLFIINPTKIGISVLSDLGNTPFAECFDPQVELTFEDKGNSVEFICKLDVVWSKNPAIKSIIQNQTVTSIKEFYSCLGKKLLKMFGAEEEEDQKEDEMEKYQDEFSKTRKIYKIIIIALLVILFLTCNLKYRNNIDHNKFFHFIIKAIVLSQFLLLLIFF